MSVRIDDPILLLRREHDEALAVLDQLELAVSNLTAPGALAAVQSAIAFLDQEVRGHNEREEECLFPMIERYLLPAGPTAVMRSEHRDLWTLLTALKAGVQELPPSTSTIHQQGLLVVDLLRRHIAKENQVLFPMATQLLTRDEMADVARQMELHIQARASGGAVFEAS
jgi:hemerythrin-like domain-containing protein